MPNNVAHQLDSTFITDVHRSIPTYEDDTHETMKQVNDRKYKRV